jgi:hypothetical protein
MCGVEARGVLWCMGVVEVWCMCGVEVEAPSDLALRPRPSLPCRARAWQIATPAVFTIDGPPASVRLELGAYEWVTRGWSMGGVAVA